MKWSNNNRACKTLWSTLRALDQISKRQTFDTTGKLKMNNLTYWAGTEGSIEDRAITLAKVIDGIFTEIRKAKFEKNVTSAKARKSMVAVLKEKTKTVADLADAADDAYEFRGENS